MLKIKLFKNKNYLNFLSNLLNWNNLWYYYQFYDNFVFKDCLGLNFFIIWTVNIKITVSTMNLMKNRESNINRGPDHSHRAQPAAIMSLLIWSKLTTSFSSLLFFSGPSDTPFPAWFWLPRLGNSFLCLQSVCLNHQSSRQMIYKINWLSPSGSTIKRQLALKLNSKQQPVESLLLTVVVRAGPVISQLHSCKCK